ncbi:ABC transporter permease [Roseospira navarrensis]|uniref:ABC transporter permease subunit n=1 Tax=Roseospira navarrensis TaxID=140058 RepID=A0A7X2D1Y8_9PROT|nr:ABC transporter permease subunit [Roseospira navarrensis]MQX35709.1 ABC transporter permease subunit [Roseospira navarrensis]
MTPQGSRFGPWIGGLLLLAGWELADRLLSDAFVLAGPVAVARFLMDEGALMGRALAVTLGNAAVGFVIGNLAALALAGVAVVWPRSERVVTGLALLVFCLPLVATGPILRVLFGPGPGPQITLAALAVYYTTLIPLLVGLRAVPDTWVELVRSTGRGRLAVLVHVRAMAALPALCAGLQIAAPAAFLGAMVGEFTGAERGMGVLTIRAMRALDVPMTWSLATVATAVAVLAYLALGALARRVLRAPPPVILAAPSVRSKQGAAWRDVALVAALALGGWAAVIGLGGLNPFFAKGPGDVVTALVFAPDAPETRATLGAALAETAVFLLPGYAAGLAAGAGLAVLLVLLPGVAGTVLPLAIALRSVPIVTTAPLVVLLLGRGALGTIVLVAVMVFFPTLVACLHGLRQTPGQVLDVFDSFAAGPVTRLIRLRIPAMWPAFFAAARMAVPASVLAVTVVEWLATGSGMGRLMALSASLSDYDMLWSCVVVVSVLAALGYALVGAVERRVLAVYAPEQQT